jgi:hypothetical protein
VVDVSVIFCTTSPPESIEEIVDYVQVEVVVPVLRKPDQDLKFAGISGPSPLPSRCFVSVADVSVCVFSSPYLNCGHIYAVPVEGT